MRSLLHPKLELDEEPETDNVLKWERMSGKGVGPEKDRIRVMEKRRSVLGAAHLTPLSQKAPALQRERLHYVKGESRWYCEGYKASLL